MCSSMSILWIFSCFLYVSICVHGEIYLPNCLNNGDNWRAFSQFNASESPTTMVCPKTDWLQLFKNADLQSAVQGSVVLSHYGYKMVSVGFNKGYDFAKWFQMFAPNTKFGPGQWYQALKTIPSVADDINLCGMCGECKTISNSSADTSDPVMHFVGIDLNRQNVALVQSVERELNKITPSENKTYTLELMHGIVGSPFTGKEMTVRKCPAGEMDCKIMDYQKASAPPEGYEFVPVLNLNEVLVNLGVLYKDNHRRLMQQPEVWRQQPAHISTSNRPEVHSQHQTLSSAFLANQRNQQQHSVINPAHLDNTHHQQQHLPGGAQAVHSHVQPIHTSHASATLPTFRSSQSSMTSLQRQQLATKQIQTGEVPSPPVSTVDHHRVHNVQVLAQKPHPPVQQVHHTPPPPVLPIVHVPRSEMIDILQISAGGLEAHVLQACEPSFAARRVRAVSFDFGNASSWQQISLWRVVQGLSRNHYECYLQGQKGLWAISGNCWADNYHDKDSQGSVLCVLRSDPWLEAIQPLVVTVPQASSVSDVVNKE